MTVPVKKTKIVLADYSYRRDIELRLLLSDLSVLEVQVLQEIIHSSLQIKIQDLADTLNIDVAVLHPILAKLGATQLYKQQQNLLQVDKEVRKYLEFQIEKFDEDFKPDLEFLQNVLNKVPIHILPSWYAIPRTSDRIFPSIVEKYFSTPAVFRQHLAELQFDDPVLKGIVHDVYHAPQFKITAKELIQKYKLSRKQFEEYLLLLEYHFVSCLSYNRIDESWQEVVTPFAEWREYLLFEEQTKPIAISEPIDQKEIAEFGFIKDMALLLTICDRKRAPFNAIKKLNLNCPAKFDDVLQKLVQMEFVDQNEQDLFLTTAKGKAWLSKSLSEQATYLSSDPLNTLSADALFEKLWTSRNLRMIEKSLRRLATHQWVEFNQFFFGFTAPLGDKEPIALKNKGKKWKYVLPSYSEHEKQFIKSVIMERLFELGVVNIGTYRGNACFCLTPFGHQFIH